MAFLGRFKYFRVLAALVVGGLMLLVTLADMSSQSIVSASGASKAELAHEAQSAAQSSLKASPHTETITINVQTEEYRFQDGLHVEGYRLNDVPGAPALPVWYEVVELPPTGEWEIEYESVGMRVLDHSQQVVIPAVAVPELTPEDMVGWVERAEFPSQVTTVQRPDKAIYQKNAFYPASPVLEGTEQWQRGERYLALRVFPFQYNPVSRTLRHHPDLRITIHINGVDKTPLRGPQLGVGEWGSGRVGGEDRPFPPHRAIASGGAVRIYTTERGLYRLTYDDLVNAGVPNDTVPATFAMSYLGQSIDILVTGETDGSFDQGDEVIFYAQPYEGRYMTENVYRLSYGGANGSRIATRSSPLNTTLSPTNEITQTLHVEFNRRYMTNFERAMDADHWYDNPLNPTTNNPKSVTYNLDLDNPRTTGRLQIRGLLHGTSDQVQPIDHWIEVLLNGTSVNTHQWNGAVEHSFTDTLAANLLNGSTDQIKLTADTSQIAEGPSSYTVYPDWIEITYPALADADGSDRIYIEQMPQDAKRVRVTGFSAASGGVVRVIDVRDPLHPVELTTTQAQNTGHGYNLDFWDQELPNPTYFLSTDAALLAPSAIEFDSSSTWQSNTHVADYIAIVHQSLWEAPAGLLGIDDLLAHRQAEGLRVAKVDVQDIYDEWSHGRVDPQAIRDFLTYAYYNWNQGEEPPEYVLLVGDGSYDFKNHANTPLLNLIPPFLVHVDPWIGEVPVDNRYVSVDSPDDYLPEMHIGRISAQVKWDENSQTYLDPAVDVDAIVHKILRYEDENLTLNGDWQKRVVFVADNWDDQAGNFHAISDDIRQNWLPPSYHDSGIYYNSDSDHNSGAEMRAAIKADGFNNDALMIQWFGHGNKVRWGSVSMFNHYDLEGYQGNTPLEQNNEWPLTVSYACLTSYFTHQVNYNNANVWQSLGEAMLRAKERGSVADIGPTGLHVANAAKLMNQGIMEAIYQNREARVGAALDAARLYYWSNTRYWLDAIDTHIILGDPATRLRLPSIPMPLENSTISVDEEMPSGGQQVTFTVNLVNDSNNAVTDIVLTIDYDQDKLTIVNAPGATNDDDKLTWTESSVAVGTTMRTFSATVDEGFVAGTKIDTQAKIRANMENVNLSQALTIDPLVPTIPPNSDDMLLRWPHVTRDSNGDPLNVTEYQIWRSSEPYFTPGDVGSSRLSSLTSPFSGPTLAYTDTTAAINDTATNHYHLIRAVDSGGGLLEESNRVGEYDFELTAGTSDSDLSWSSIAIPLELSNVTSADEVAGYIDAAGGIKKVAKWDSSSQSWVVRRVGAPFGTQNFPVTVGDTLFVGANQDVPAFVSWLGVVPTSGSLQYSLTANAWNYLMVPYEKDILETADGLAADIGGVTKVAKWDASSQSWVVRRVGAPFGTGNYSISGGYSYFIFGDNSMPPNWP